MASATFSRNTGPGDRLGPSPADLLRAVNDLPGYARAAGIEVVHASHESVELRMPRRADLVQFNGAMHGGAIAGLADHAAGAAVAAALGGERIGVTIDLHLNLLRLADGEELIARARPVQVGSTIGVATVELLSVASGGTETTCGLATAVLRLVRLTTGPERDSDS